MVFKKLLLEGDAATELTGTGYKTLIVSNGAVAELAHGEAGYFLKSGGDAADPSWDVPSVPTLDAIGDVAAIVEAQGQVIFRGAAAWDALDAGSAGDLLTSGGAAADPAWAALSIPADAVGATEIDELDTAITVAQLIFAPAAEGSGTAEGTVFYDLDDDHLYVYVGA